MANPKRGDVYYGRFKSSQLRIAAIKSGQVTYISDYPCAKGHLERYVNGYKCVECKREAQRATWPQRSKNRKFTPEQMTASRERVRAWRKNNPAHRNALAANYEKRVKAQTPKWASLREIVEFYKNRPSGFHVDHIIPLRGDNVSGLHVIGNLQYLTAEQNYKKNRKYEVQNG